MKSNFNGKSIDECIKKAENELSIKRDQFNYVIVKNGGLFKKHYEIEVTLKEVDEGKEILNALTDKETNEEEQAIKVEEEKSQDIMAKDGTIIFAEGVDGEFQLVFDKNALLKINGIEATQGAIVTSKDSITYEMSKIDGTREVNIKSDTLSASISINYVPSIVDDCYCIHKGNVINIKKITRKGELPPHFSSNEITEMLRERGIVSGILDDKIKEVCKEDKVENIVIAEGTPAVDDENDRIDVKFQNTAKRVKADSDDTIDYRNMYAYANVEAGEVLGELIVGQEGKNGLSIFGVEIPRKFKKVLQLKVTKGCKIEDGKVISTIEGEPAEKNGVFCVHEVLDTTSDVDVKTGNIDFIGDVKIEKSVKEGMTVKAGNRVDIIGNVETATVISQGEANIGGSIINSTIKVGSKNMVMQQYLDGLSELKNNLSQLIECHKELKEKPAFMNKNDGEMIKLLIENKFKTLPRKSLLLMNNEYNDNMEIKNFINDKLIGMGPLNIKFINELYAFIDKLDEEMKPLSNNVFVPVDIYINYVQDSNVNATGTIFINGKGQYVSTLTALKDIVFTNDGSVSRGGTLTASGNIKCSTIGSSAGVSTTLKVKKRGIITAKVVYRNTVFIIGDRQYTFEDDSKDVRAYFEKGDIVVDKFKL